MYFHVLLDPHWFGFFCQVAAAYMTAKLRRPVSAEVAACLHEAERASSVDCVLDAMEVISALAACFTAEHAKSKGSSSVFTQDAENRTGALAVHALTKDEWSTRRAKVMAAWLSRYPADATSKIRQLSRQ